MGYCKGKRSICRFTYHDEVTEIEVNSGEVKGVETDITSPGPIRDQTTWEKRWSERYEPGYQTKSLLWK